MGADITVRRPKNLDTEKLIALCSSIPIDVKINDKSIDFHYGYWGADHAEACESFVSNFCKRNKIKHGKWNY